MRQLFFKCLLVLSTVPFLGGLIAKEEQTAHANGIEIWYETFGQKEDPALLMIMGGCTQGILWPTEFCKRLAREGFYVIRYDHRDAGFSTCFDFEKHPYDLLEMAKDAIGLLDCLGIEKAHLFGLSMGGPIAELMSVHFPDRILSIALAATSSDFEPCTRGFDGLPRLEGSMSHPKEQYISWMNEFMKIPPQTDDEKLEQRLSGWRILNGSLVAFEEEMYREIHREFLARLRNPSAVGNHISAMKQSLDQIRFVPSQVKVPTVIFHGSEDPIFPPDHGESLAAAISGSKYVLIEGFGHVPNGYFYDLMVQEIKQNADR